MTEEITRTAPYGSFETTKNAIAGFAEGVPHRIDRSAFPGLAWNAASRLITGLKFLDLINDLGQPMPSLEKLATPDEAVRKRVLESILRTQYSKVFELDLTRTTPSLLAETFAEHYNATGDTLEKAVRFFLAACQYVGIPVSPLLTRAQRRSTAGANAGKPRKVTTTQKKPGTTGAADSMPVGPVMGAARRINLESGGTLSVSAAVDFLTLSASDRKFVFEVIDRLSEYENAHPVTAPSEDGDDDD
jgi:hypothetical protein